MRKVLTITICFFLVLYTISSCVPQTKNEKWVVGNVYISEDINSYIKGFRIDEIKADSVYIRYAFDKELFLGVSMFHVNKNKFKSNKAFNFYSPVKFQSQINLEIIDDNKIYLRFRDENGDMKQQKYSFLYKDTIIEAEIRNPYYSEDGFNIQ